MKVKALLTALAGLAIATAAQAATITYTLSLNDNGSGALTPGSFAVYGSANTGDNAGIAAVTFITNNDLTTTFKGVQSTFTDPEGVGDPVSVGFTLLRRNGNEADATGKTSGGQNVDNPVVYNMGQAAGDLRVARPAGYIGGSTNPASGQYSLFANPILLAVGTFNAATPVTLTDGAGNLFLNTTSKTTIAGNIAYATQDLAAVPEPTSLAVLGLAGLGLAARRRKA